MDAYHINKWLKPLSALYGVGVRVRNYLFDRGVLKSTSYDIPIICVGNITVGGTGKTPHVEYLVNLLHSDYSIAIVSRGYKRKTKGLIVATEKSTAREIGDEPSQIKHKFPSLTVVVDSNRRRAINYLCTLPQENRPELILMDDGFQHRWVKADFNIVLIDFNRIISKDCLLPAGRLREPARGLQRADSVILTKCPNNLTPIEFRGAERDLALYPHQKLLFSKLCYGKEIQGLFHNRPLASSTTHILAIAGIANPKPYFQEIHSRFPHVIEKHFADHHNFSKNDISTLFQEWSNIHEANPNAVIVCTEKDAMRLASIRSYLPEQMQENLYYLPIEVKLMFDTERAFVSKLQAVIRNKQKK